MILVGIQVRQQQALGKTHIIKDKADHTRHHRQVPAAIQTMPIKVELVQMAARVNLLAAKIWAQVKQIRMDCKPEAPAI